MVVTSLAQFEQLVSGAPAEVVADVENLPDCEPGLANLLGVAIAWPGQSFYVAINQWNGESLVRVCDVGLESLLRGFLKSRGLVGWNIEHDREWVGAAFGISTTWKIDGRILWYLTDKEQTERGYSLKSAQIALLGWAESNDRELRDAVALAGGSLDRGQHYLAPLPVLGRYAVLDAIATLEAVALLRPYFDENNYWHAHDANRDYAAFLAAATRRGVIVDEFALKRAKNFYSVEVERATAAIRAVCAPEIAVLEKSMLEQTIAKKGYKTARGLSDYLSAPQRHPKFNPKSSAQRAKLLYDVLGLPILEKTEGGLPSTKKDVIAKLAHPSAQAFVTLSENKKLYEMAESYFSSCEGGLIHFPHDTCATVSERLGGFKPYDLNMPFDSEPIMRAFSVRAGSVGIHMDLVSIEPCLIAGFSGDATMLKVYRDELGDIYLDLCLDLFPIQEAGQYEPRIAQLIRQFHSEYNTNAPPQAAQKERFGVLRKVAKIIQLAVGYTGTKFTVAKNLTAAGFPTSIEKADLIVYRYWERFKKVEELGERLKAVARRQGYINGLFGRRLYIPKSQLKDSLNRFGQHGGHAILREIVQHIDQQSRKLGIRMYPLLPDIHDSTSWECSEDQIDAGIRVFEDAVGAVNSRLGLPVRVRGEIKRFHTFYGLKNREG